MTAPGFEHFNGLRVLVTGASGFIGSHLVDRLAGAGAVVGALARSRGKLAELPETAAYTFLQCDLTDGRETSAAFREFRPHTLLHFASRADTHESFEHLRDSLDVNVLGTLHALEGLKAAGGRVVVYGDSCKVYGGQAAVPYREATPTVPNSSYAISKLAGWQICELYGRLHGIAAVTVRPTLIHGPRQSYNLFTFIVDQLMSGRMEILLDGGTQTRDPLFIDDAVDAVLATALRADGLAGRIINIGGGHECSVEALSRLTVAALDSLAAVTARPERARPTEMWRSYCDNDEANALVGWRPKTPLDVALRQTVAYLKARQVRGGALA